MEINKNFKIAICIIISLVVVLFSYIIYIKITHTPIEIKTSPEGGEIFYNSKWKKTPGIFNFKNGENKITARKENYEEKKITFDTVNFSEKALDIPLTIKKTLSLEEALTLSKEETQTFEEEVAKEMNKYEEAFNNNNKLIEHLPYYVADFHIDYGIKKAGDKKAYYLITIYHKDASDKENIKKAAIDWIRSKEIDSEKLEIDYKYIKTNITNGE